MTDGMKMLRAIIAHVDKHGAITNRECRELFDLPYDHAIKLLGGCLRHLKPVHLPGIAEDRYLVIIDKIARTPPQYPRRVGLAAKKTL